MPTTKHRKELDDAATRTNDALGVSHQLLEMLTEYTALEAQHAAQLRALAQRMGGCVDRMRSPGELAVESDNQREQEEQQEPEDAEEELRARRGQCVAVMDEVVTFLTRFASMHSHLSECLAGDLIGEWSEALAVQNKRVDAQEPELSAARAQLQVTEHAYRHAHTAFREDFAHACALYADATGARLGTVEPGDVERAVQDELATIVAAGDVPQRRVRSQFKAMQYVGSISKLLRPSGSGGSQRRSVTKRRQPEPREIAEAITTAEHQRQECHEAFQAMQRLHVRCSRLTESTHQEYRCVQSECLASTRTSIRKLVIHVSAFTSNLQYDATQLFQHVEALHASELKQRVQTLPTTELPVAAAAFVPPPPSNVPLSLEHIAKQRFPVVNERPRLLRHQNACHVLPV